MALEIPVLGDFDEIRGPVKFDPETKSSLTSPVVFQSFVPSGVSRMPYVTLTTAVQVIDPNGLGVCQPLSTLSASFRMNGVNLAGNTALQTDKTVIASVLGLLGDAIAETSVVIPAPAAAQ